MNNEIIELAKKCKNAEEIIALAKERGVELTEAEAKNYFAMLNKKNCELSDEELNVAGGTTYDACTGQVIVIPAINSCDLFKPAKKDCKAVCCNCAYFAGDWKCGIRRKGADPIND